MWCSLVVDKIFLGLNIPLKGSAAVMNVSGVIDNTENQVTLKQKGLSGRVKMFWFCFNNDNDQMKILWCLFYLQYACKESEAWQPLDILRGRGKNPAKSHCQ